MECRISNRSNKIVEGKREFLRKLTKTHFAIGMRVYQFYTFDTKKIVFLHLLRPLIQ